MVMRYQFSYDSPIGTILMEEMDGSIVRLYLPGTGGFDSEVCETPVLKETSRQLDEYFKGERKQFDVPISPEGTDFQKRVWSELVKIPYGKTCTYGELAARSGCPKGARAIGMAMNRNPISIIQPCHRVLGSNGKLTGFAGGIRMKEELLRLEGSL